MEFAITFFVVSGILLLICGLVLLLITAYVGKSGVADTAKDLWTTYFGDGGNDLPSRQDLPDPQPLPPLIEEIDELESSTDHDNNRP